ncbi:MAG: nuclear transport factor 2 family protein [Burkholderiaceae bacterium]|nr:nuclear transport factor 2 family protein [Burkholderiaceae bacterium]
MNINLPIPIAAYFSADKLDGETVSRCFTSDAIVMDEGRTHVGQDAIKRWKAEASTKYTYTAEPCSVEQKDGTIIVTSRLTGNFPGSPVDLRYFFVLQRGKIVSLEIKP